MTDIKPKESNSIEKLEKKFKKQLFWIIVISATLIIGLWSLNYLYSWQGVEFGSKFNIVNSLFSGLAFAGIIITVLLQKQELTLQRKELEATRDVFLKQNSLMDSQRNDAIFFKLLENHRQLVEGFKSGNKKLLNPNDIYKKNSSSPIYGSEIVSGYQNIYLIAEYLRTYFKCYSESFKQKRIIEFLLAEHMDFKSLMNAEPITALHYRELQNLYLFVQNKLSNDSLYLNTLDVNLTFDERFLFEVSYHYFPVEREELKYENKNYFNHSNFVDFEKNILPYCHAEVLEDRNRAIWVFVQTNGKVKSAELDIYQREGQFRYMVIKDKVLISVENVVMTESGLYQLDISLIEYLIKSNLSIYNYPTQNRNAISDKHLVFDIEIAINGISFNYYFQLDFTESVRDYGNDRNFELTSFRNLKINEISKERYSELIQANWDYSKNVKTHKPQQERIQRINMLIWNYFQKNPNTELIPALELMPEFVAAGIFEKDDPKRKGIAIRKILRDLDKNNQLDQIPFVFPDRKKKNTNWFFKRIK